MAFTALHRLLGRPAGPISDDLIDAAVTERLAETSDLDWKSQLPPTSKLTDSDFPKDIAAMANSGGGVIVYGVEEVQKRASGRNDVGVVSEHHERTLRSAAYGAITPPVFLELHPVGMPGKMALVVVVPPTVDGPHLIFKDKFFGAPLRNDADTEWMKERQIEAAYRARLEERRRSAVALTDLYDEIRENWPLGSRVLLIAAARPQTPVVTDTRFEQSDARSVFSEAEKLGATFAGPAGVHPLQNVANSPRRGLRRWVAVNTATSDKSLWRAASAAVHDDGAVSIVATVGGHNNPWHGGHFRDTQVDSSAIELAIADLMALIRAWSGRLGTANYDVRLGMEWGGSKPLVMHTTDTSGYFFDGTSVPLRRYTPVEVTIDAAASNTDFVRQMYRMAEDCINQGGITNVRTIDHPGSDE